MNLLQLKIKLCSYIQSPINLQQRLIFLALTICDFLTDFPKDQGAPHVVLCDTQDYNKGQEFFKQKRNITAPLMMIACFLGSEPASTFKSKINIANGFLSQSQAALTSYSDILTEDHHKEILGHR